MKVVTMRGKTLDMGALIARNPHAVAVGNAQMNARGDIINARGKVVKPREQIAMEYHASNPRSVRTVGIRSLTSEMLQSPADAVAAMQAATRTQAAQPAQPAAGTPSADPWAAQKAPLETPVAPARKRKLIDPDEPIDGAV